MAREQMEQMVSISITCDTIVFFTNLEQTTSSKKHRFQYKEDHFSSLKKTKLYLRYQNYFFNSYILQFFVNRASFPLLEESALIVNHWYSPDFRG